MILRVPLADALLSQTPAELSIGQVLLPPALLVCIYGFVVTLILAKILNRTRLTRFVWFPPLTFLALWLMMSACIGLWFIAP